MRRFSLHAAALLLIPILTGCGTFTKRLVRFDRMFRAAVSEVDLGVQASQADERSGKSASEEASVRLLLRDPNADSKQVLPPEKRL